MQTAEATVRGTAPARAPLPAAIPDGLAQMPPGPKLAAALAAIDLAEVSGTDAVTVLQACQRQENHTRAVKLAAAVEVALRAPHSVHTIARMAAPDRYSPDEIRAALALSVPGSEQLLGLAWDLVVRLPQLHAAMLAGDLDEQRAWALARWTTELSDAHARHVVTELLPRCSVTDPDALTTAQVIDKARKLAVALDPDWAERTYKAAIKRRNVTGRRNEDGTATLSGYQLEIDRVAAACARLDLLAKTAKAHGDPRPIGHLRADLYLGMLDGTFESLTDAEILLALAATRPAPEAAGADATGVEGGGPGTADPATAEPASTAGTSAPSEPSVPAAPGAARPSLSGVDLRVRLSSLLGLDRHPAELAGWGPVHAELATQLIERLGPAQWRYAITNDHGHLERCGLTPARPAGIARRQAGHRGIVELQIPAALLSALICGRREVRQNADPTALMRWTPVLGDLFRRMHNPDATEVPEDPHRRFPRAGLRRQIEIRIPRCIGVGCRRASTRSEMEHRRDHAHGGLTTGENLAPGCGHDHDLKTKGGWRLHTLGPDTYLWTTRLGRHYRVTVAPILEALPDPKPTPPPAPFPDRENGDLDENGRPWQNSTLWEPAPRPEPEPDPELLPRPPPDPADDTLPF